MRGLRQDQIFRADGGSVDVLVKELRDELAKAKGEFAKEARRRAEAEECMAEIVARSEIQGKLFDSQEKSIATHKKLIDVQKDNIEGRKRLEFAQHALIANLDDEMKEKDARIAYLERRLAKYEEVEPPGEGANVDS